MENIKEQFKRLFCELDLTDDQAAMIRKLQRDVDATLHQQLVKTSLADAVGRNCPFCGEPCVECSHKATGR